MFGTTCILYPRTLHMYKVIIKQRLTDQYCANYSQIKYLNRNYLDYHLFTKTSQTVKYYFILIYVWKMYNHRNILICGISINKYDKYFPS